MPRSITTIDGRPFIHTTNGVDTRTAPLYVKELKDYRPEPNGFVAELGQDILEIISEHPKLWAQGNWRASVEAVPGSPFSEELKAFRATPLPDQGPVCGTTMCIAGWAGELSGADWMVDADTLDQHLFETEDTVIVSAQAWKELAPCNYTSIQGIRLGSLVAPSSLLHEVLTERGFTPEHLAVNTSAYACGVLGLVHGDWLDLFDGDLGFDRVKELIEGYTRYGVVPSEEAIAALHPEWVREAEYHNQDVLTGTGLGGHFSCSRAAAVPA